MLFRGLLTDNVETCIASSPLSSRFLQFFSFAHRAVFIHMFLTIQTRILLIGTMPTQVPPPPLPSLKLLFHLFFQSPANLLFSPPLLFSFLAPVYTCLPSFSSSSYFSFFDSSFLPSDHVIPPVCPTSRKKKHTTLDSRPSAGPRTTS